MVTIAKSSEASGPPYVVMVKKKVRKRLGALPLAVQERFLALVNDLTLSGPIQPSWMNSQLGNNNFHCHLGYHHVACWHWENGTITIEVYYVGSREGAPY